MPHFMRDDVGFGEFAGRAEAILQLAEKAEIEVDLLVAGTVERSSGGFRRAAGGIDDIVEKDQLGVPIIGAVLGQHLVQVRCTSSSTKLTNSTSGCSAALRAGSTGRATLGAGLPPPYTKERTDQVATENETEHQQNKQTSGADVKPAESAEPEPASAAAIVAAILDIITYSTRCPAQSIRPPSV